MKLIKEISKGKTYIGTTDEGERVFIKWCLQLNSNTELLEFSMSGYYLNAAGTDYSSCGQCLDTIIQHFTDSEQAREMHDVWKRYNNNQMNAGTARQRECINKYIKPRFEIELNNHLDFVKTVNIVDDRILKKLDKLTLEPHKIRNRLYQFITLSPKSDKQLASNLFDVSSYNVSQSHKAYGYDRQELRLTEATIALVRKSYMGVVNFKFNTQREIASTKLTLPYDGKTSWGDKAVVSCIESAIPPKPTMDHDYICKALRNHGLLHDTEYMVDVPGLKYEDGKIYFPESEIKFVKPKHRRQDKRGVYVIEKHLQLYQQRPYTYGQEMLTEEIPQNVIDQINSWVEVPQPSTPTLVQQFIIDHNVSISDGEYNPKRDVNEWRINIGKNDTDYEYFTGTAISTDNKQSLMEGAISSLMSDAYIGSQDDPIEYLMEELGYEDYKKAKHIAEECIKTSRKLSDLYDIRLSM